MGRMLKAMAWKRRLARALGRPEKLAVLGVGNVARGDDAAGVRVAEALTSLAGGGATPRFKVFVTDEAPENFTGPVREFAPTHVLIIDAVAAGFRPGAIFIVEPGAVPEEDVSTHRTPLSTLAGYLERTVGCRVVILGIEPAALAPGAPLSPAARRAIERVAASLARFASRRLRSSSASGRRYS